MSLVSAPSNGEDVLPQVQPGGQLFGVAAVGLDLPGLGDGLGRELALDAVGGQDSLTAAAGLLGVAEVLQHRRFVGEMRGYPR